MKIKKMAVAFGLAILSAASSVMAAGGFESESEQFAESIFDLGYAVFVPVAALLIIVTIIAIKWRGWEGFMYVVLALFVVGVLPELMDMTGHSFSF